MDHHCVKRPRYMETEDIGPCIKKNRISSAIPDSGVFLQLLFEQKRINQRMEDLAVQQNQRMEQLEKQFAEHRLLHQKVLERLNLFLDSMNKMNNLLKLHL